MPISPSKHRRKALGFSLVEVLVSIVVLSFGLLGMVGLQAMALQANRDARLQSVATGLARELGEMMRGNAEIAAKTTSNPYLVSDLRSRLASPTPSSCLNIGSNCTGGTPADTALNIAKAQITEWLARVENELPSPRVTVCLDSAPYDSAGMPRWACTQTSGGGDTVMVKIGWTRNPYNRSASNSNTSAGTPQLATDGTPGVIVPVSMKP